MRVKALTFVSILCLLAASCNRNKEVAVTGITLSEKSIELTAGDTYTLKAQVLPADAANKKVTWTSRVPAIATVNQEGLVTALAMGASTIEAVTEDGGFKASCAVIVSQRIIHVESVSLHMTSIGLTEGGSVYLSAKVLPENATDPSVTWSASPESVITVEQNGCVTAVGPGEGTVTVTTTDGGFKDSCVVTVDAATVNVESVTLDCETLELLEGENARLTATVLPENATEKTVVWKSLNAGVATVDQEGLVTALQAGETTISAECGAKAASCRVTVKKIEVDGVNVTPAILTLMEGETARLSATVSPAEADQSVQWASQDIAIATVDKDGLVTALKPGTTRIYARSVAFPDKQAACELTVQADATLKGIELSSTVMELQIGESRTLTVRFTPEYAANKNVAWSSSEPSVASVDADGTVTAYAPGTAVVTATAEDGGHTASCTVTVSGTAGPQVYYWQSGVCYVNGVPDARNGMFNESKFTLSTTSSASAAATLGQTLYTVEKYSVDGLQKLYLCRDRKPLFALPSDTPTEFYSFVVQPDYFAILTKSNAGSSYLNLIKGNYEGAFEVMAVGGSFKQIYYPKMLGMPDKTLYITGQITDAFNTDYLALYTVPKDNPNMEEQLIEQNPVAKPSIAADEDGNIYILADRYTSDLSHYECALYKNGVLTEVIDEVEINYRGALFWRDGQLFSAIWDYANSEIRIRKGGALIYTIGTNMNIHHSDPAPLVVMPSGDVYLAVRGINQAALYKNGELLYSDPQRTWTFNPFCVIE